MGKALFWPTSVVGAYRRTTFRGWSLCYWIDGTEWVWRGIKCVPLSSLYKGCSSWTRYSTYTHCVCVFKIFEYPNIPISDIFLCENTPLGFDASVFYEKTYLGPFIWYVLWAIYVIYCCVLFDWIMWVALYLIRSNYLLNGHRSVANSRWTWGMCVSRMSKNKHKYIRICEDMLTAFGVYGCGKGLT